MTNFLGPLTFLLLFTAGLFCPGQSAAEAKYQRSEVSISVPDVVLINQDNEKIPLRSLLQTEESVVIDFVYASCTTICPILSAGYANLQGKLGPENHNILLVSITIDPENDTPAVMKKHLERYQARPGWIFLTGSRADINTVMAAFDAYFPNKMSHQPLNFIRTTEKGKWIRINGMIGGNDLLNEIKKARMQ
ncbi:MAG: SCO family protein [Proteobacteria bacterium]|nr:SCO family protein [Pseudomonadota bacterium]MBU0966477.1 SCO family protein [Pseudomonadota bacterium]